LSAKIFAIAAITLVTLAVVARAEDVTPKPTVHLTNGATAVPLDVSAVGNIAGTYTGSGHDSVLGQADYVIVFRQSGSSLKALLTAVSATKKTLQTGLNGSVTRYGYTIKAFGKCTGTVRGYVNGSEISGLYGALKCGGVVHSGSFGAEKFTAD
jgi:hypothetical protein